MGEQYSTGEGDEVVGRTQGRGRLRQVGLTAALTGFLAVYAVTADGADAAGPKPAEPAMTPAAEDGPVRQTEAEAAAHAARVGQRVEIGAFRGESREVYANPDGTTTEVQHVQPVRVVRDGRWMPVDSTLARGPDGSIGPRAATLGMRLSRGGDDPLLRVERAGRVLTLDWPGRLPEPVVDGDRATYPEVLPGVDLVINVGVTGFSHVVVVKTPEAARNPDLAELEFGLSTDGLSVRPDAEGGLAAVDEATGGAVLEANRPIMWDSGMPAGSALAKAAARSVDPRPAAAFEAPDSSARRARLGLRVGSGKLTLVPDRAMLTSPDTRWPVYLDPVWQDTRNSSWTMVASGFPSEEYWKFGGETTEGVGECPVSSGRCNGVGVKRLFYALPTPYAGRTIISAEFRVTMTHTYDGSAKSVRLYRAGAGISSSTNWNNQPAWSAYQDEKSPTAERGNCTSTNQNVGFNATAAVREAVTRNWSTTTFGLRAENESDHTAWKRFCGNAILSVNYNRAPTQPRSADLSMNPGGGCVYGAARPYVSSLPTLYAVLRDPDTADAEPLTAQFRVIWTPAGGTQQTKTWTHTTAKNSGSAFSYSLANATSGLPALPENVVVSWDVRANDGQSWGPWSSDGTANPCEFVLDKTRPAGPDIDSAKFLPSDSVDNGTAAAPDCVEDDTWYDGVGRYGTFTFDSSATDVVSYEFGFDADPSPDNALRPTADGGPVSVSWLAETEAPHRVRVRAVDRAGKTSDTTECIFRVAAGAPAVGEWGLADDPGSAAAADAREAHPAAAGSGVTFGVDGPGGMADRAARLTGEADSHLVTASAGLVGTAGSFTVSAWVRLTDETRDRVAVSQDGSGEPGFTLGFDAATKKWVFKAPVTDVDTLGMWQVTGPTALTGEWVHLVGAYDAVKGRLALYVNGVAAGTGERRSAWKSRGAIQLGRRLAKTGYTDHWVGDLAEVAVFSRLVTGSEISQLAALVPARAAYWELDTAVAPDTAPDVLISPEHTGDETKNLTLYNGAAVYAPDPDVFPPPESALVGGGHAVLDGQDDYGATAGPIARTDRSFSISVRVRLASACGRSMAVLSQPGTAASGFTLRCGVVGATARWEVVMPHSDSADDPPASVVFDDQRLPNTDAAGQHLALVYNAYRNELVLYVDGQVAGSGQASHASAWQAAGGLQLGRALANGAWVDHLAGVVDDVRVYAGVLDQTTVQRLASPTEQTDL